VVSLPISSTHVSLDTDKNALGQSTPRGPAWSGVASAVPESVTSIRTAIRVDPGSHVPEQVDGSVDPGLHGIEPHLVGVELPPVQHSETDRHRNVADIGTGAVRDVDSVRATVVEEYSSGTEFDIAKYSLCVREAPATYWQIYYFSAGTVLETIGKPDFSRRCVRS
jgi:hypothetical protein